MSILFRFGAFIPAVAAALASATFWSGAAQALECRNPQCRAMITESCLSRRSNAAIDTYRYQRSQCGKQYQRYRDCVELVVNECGDNANAAPASACGPAEAERRWSGLAASEDVADLLVFADACRGSDEAVIAQARVETLVKNRLAFTTFDGKARAKDVERAMAAVEDYMPASRGAAARLERRLKDGWFVGHAVLDALGSDFVYRDEATRAICDTLFEETCPGYVAVAPPVTFKPQDGGDGAEAAGADADGAAPVQPAVAPQAAEDGGDAADPAPAVNTNAQPETPDAAAEEDQPEPKPLTGIRSLLGGSD